MIIGLSWIEEHMRNELSQTSSQKNHFRLSQLTWFSYVPADSSSFITNSQVIRPVIRVGLNLRDFKIYILFSWNNDYTFRVQNEVCDSCENTGA